MTAETAHTKAAPAAPASAVFRAPDLVCWAEIARANADAVVETGRALNGGLKALGQGTLADGRQTLASFSEDLAELAAISTPADVLRLQQRLARRNAELAVATFTRTGQALGELASAMMAPLTACARSNVAAIRPRS